ncbi:MAG: outer membrane lipoprotein-sorting protein [Gammaproteobacteria bacterium]|nr:outer membrane lipoprotein-sorting protein [Gammaproteobacteria bacterium]
MKKLYIIPLLVFSLMVPGVVSALSIAQLPSGDEVAQRINARDEGVSVSRTLVMEMTDRRGKTRLRKTRGLRKYFGDDKRTVIFYLTPKNVKDTAFLTYDYVQASRDDDQWLYLPAMRKVRRISASDRGDYFLGTDFTYEDIKKESKVSIEDYVRRTMGEAVIDGHRCIIVESIPVNRETAKELGYGKVTQWIDAEIWMARKAEFEDLRGKRLKTIYTREIRQVQGIWTAHVLEAIHHKTGHSTTFTFSDVDYQTEIRDDLFTERALRRGL